MIRRMVMFGAMAATVIVAAVAILAVLDVITLGDLRGTLGRSLLVVGIATTALLLLMAFGKAAMWSSRDTGRP